jgi:hypothetical protein
LLQLIETCAGIDAQLLLEQLAEPPVQLECLGRPPAAVQRQHQQCTRCLSKGMVRNEGLQPRDRVEMSADGDQPLEPALYCAEVNFLELGAKPLHHFVIGNLRVGITEPQSLGGLVRRQPLGSTTASKKLPPTLDQGAEPGGVDRLGRDGEGVPLSPGDQDGATAVTSPQGLAKVRDVRAQRDGGLRWWSAVPQLVDQPLRRHDPPGVQQEQQE